MTVALIAVIMKGGPFCGQTHLTNVHFGESFEVSYGPINDRIEAAVYEVTHDQTETLYVAVYKETVERIYVQDEQFDKDRAKSISSDSALMWTGDDRDLLWAGRDSDPWW